MEGSMSCDVFLYFNTISSCHLFVSCWTLLVKALFSSVRGISLGYDLFLFFIFVTPRVFFLLCSMSFWEGITSWAVFVSWTIRDGMQNAWDLHTLAALYKYCSLLVWQDYGQPMFWHGCDLFSGLILPFLEGLIISLSEFEPVHLYS